MTSTMALPMATIKFFGAHGVVLLGSANLPLDVDTGSPEVYPAPPRRECVMVQAFSRGLAQLLHASLRSLVLISIAASVV